MYKIIVDSKLMHDPNIPNLKVIEPNFEPEQNEKGQFSFSIALTHPHINLIKPMKSLVYIYQDGDIIFRGRVTEDEEDTWKTKKYYCEGELGFLYDSLQPPFEYTGSVIGFFTQILTNHNAKVSEEKQFKVGTVTVTDPNDYIVRSSTSMEKSFEQLKSKLVDMLGGYLVVRHEKDGVYLDYLADLTTINTQKCELTKNIKSIDRSNTYTGIFTVIYPYGAENEDTGLRLTIEDVNEGVPYLVNQEGVEKYGWIEYTENWDDVTISTNLKNKAQARLDEGVLIENSLDIGAIDQSSVLQDIRGFRMGAKINVVSKYHGINANFVPLKMSIMLFDPSQNTITLNSTKRTLSEISNDTESSMSGVLETVEEVKNDVTINVPNRIESVKQELQSLVTQTAELLRQEVSQSYYSKDDNTELISQINTVFEQTSQSFEFQFNSFKQDLDNLLNNTNASFEDIRKYIRFVDGNIELGQIENEFKLTISKERISFTQGAQEIAYVSNSKMYNKFVEVTGSLQIGAFALTPRPNGNLAFKVV